MTYQNVWWHSPTEYGAGLNPPKTWPTVWEQYRRPTDLRQYDIPVEPYTSKLYYEHQRMGMPKYRGLFRDKPACVTSHYPTGTESKPRGFHGRLYYEQLGPNQFKPVGPQKDDLYWLEHPPYNPVFAQKVPTEDKRSRQTSLCLPQLPKDSSLALTESLRGPAKVERVTSWRPGSAPCKNT